MQHEQINENLKKIETWKRIIFMLIYALIDSMVRLILWLVVLLQVASALLTGRSNSNLVEFGRSVSTYHYHILLFLTYSTEQLPFPFADWNVSSGFEVTNKD